MASKITPLYAEARILLSLWALGDHPVAKSNFVPSGKPYASALGHLVGQGELTVEKKGRSQLYKITEKGLSNLAERLRDEAFSFSSSVGPKTANALLIWFRQQGKGDRASVQSSAAANSQSNGKASSQSNGKASSQSNGNGKASEISSYEAFSKTALTIYDELNRDYNLDDLVPIYRIRREMGDRLSRQDFNTWLLKVQANNLVQLMGGDLSNVTADQLEDSMTIPGGSQRFYVKRL
jgi:hypothetical protein